MYYIKDFTKETNLTDCGVYMITHNNTDIKYIGSTISAEGFRGRWRAHLNGLGRGKGNIVLINIKNKYGIEGFRFHIIERITDLTIVRQRERYWIDFYDTYKHGANVSLETECAFKQYDHQPMTEERKQKYLKSSPTKKTVYLYDKYGTLCHIFDSSSQCDKFLSIKRGSTSWAINHPLRTVCKIFYPSYEEKEWCPIEIFRAIRKNAAKKTVEIRRKNGSYKRKTDKKICEPKNGNFPKHKSVALYTLDGKFVSDFYSMNDCDRYLNLTLGDTCKVIKGKAKTLKRKFIPKLI